MTNWCGIEQMGAKRRCPRRELITRAAVDGSMCVIHSDDGNAGVWEYKYTPTEFLSFMKFRYKFSWTLQIA